MNTGYKQLEVWQKAMDLSVHVYGITKHFPKDEIYGLTSQMRRSAVSIPSNIAEGSRRAGKKEFAQFLRIAYGSGAELETQFELAARIDYFDSKTTAIIEARRLLDDSMRMLNRLLATLND